MVKTGYCEICNKHCDFRSKFCRSCSSLRKFHPDFKVDNPVKHIEAVEFIYCKCGCGKTRSRYSRTGLEVFYIKGHHPNVQVKKDKIIRNDGYIFVYCPEHPFRDGNGHVLEHRLVMEKYLGRYLTKEEVVHHIDENPSNNNISNLKLMLRGEHSRHHNKQDLSDRVCKVCNGNITYTNKKGIKEWRRFEDGWICSYCRKQKLRKKILNQSFLASYV